MGHDESHESDSLGRELLAELLGTFVFIMFGVGVVAQVVLSGESHGDYLSINLGWGLAVMCGVIFAVSDRRALDRSPSRRLGHRQRWKQARAVPGDGRLGFSGRDDHLPLRASLRRGPRRHAGGILGLAGDGSAGAAGFRSAAADSLDGAALPQPIPAVIYVDGFTVRPRLPTDWPAITVRGIHLHDQIIDVTARRDGSVTVAKHR